jgi:triosephosphate isomerase
MPDRPILFAANWKMHLGPAEVRDYAARFRRCYTPRDDRDTWFFPTAVSLAAAAEAWAGVTNTVIGAQDVHWELKGAFTGATSVPLARAAGAGAALIGHSERRHVFGETEADSARKLRAVLGGGLAPILCVGETLAQREAGETEAIVERQLLAAIHEMPAEDLAGLTIAYEPVWAIGTGKNATPQDAERVQAGIRTILIGRGIRNSRILYGGSVNRGNVESLLAQPSVDGVLVGGASLDPEGWAEICAVV